ncbi:MAG: BMP family ABC transporter substrate-binding protein [Erysipelotrichaceae bacterium]|nr:BMP family ABC transporter substrate-binding protein [Erysipelotrichaceae bacterium]
MKKLLKCFLSFVPLVASMCAFTSCAPKEYEYALITDVGDIDDESFNQTSWEAVKDFAEKNGKTYQYYRPTADSNDARVASIKLAIKKGAKIVVCPGFLFETAVYDVQDQYPEVKFVLIDGDPHNADYTDYKRSDNVVSILYQEEIAGYLAGYSTVMDGYTKLGFCGGMAVPAVMRFGSGFVQGASAAADAKEVDVQLKYYYAGQFQATAEATANCTSWYTAGTEVVFACGGKVYQSVVEGAKANSNGKWIGVDVDQSNVANNVLTSATKGLRESVTSALEVYASDSWTDIGGKNYNLGLSSEFGKLEKKDYVGIPTKESSWKFSTFTLDQYNTLLAAIKDGTLAISNDIAAAPTVSSRVTVEWVSAFA